jgi:hypothetical protein
MIMEEYSIWKKIFECDDDIEMENLIRLVVINDDARDLLFEKLLLLKNKPKEMINIKINIDKSLCDFPVEVLLKQISNDIMEKLNKII